MKCNKPWLQNVNKHQVYGQMISKVDVRTQLIQRALSYNNGKKMCVGHCKSDSRYPQRLQKNDEGLVTFHCFLS